MDLPLLLPIWLLGQFNLLVHESIANIPLSVLICAYEQFP
jgi:hypothetical protein